MSEQDTVAIVTGGANGIGRATCIEFATARARVVVVDTDARAAELTCEAVRATGAQAIWVQADASRSDQVQQYVKAAMQAFGRIDVLVNNAGIAGAQSPLVDYPEDVFERVLRVNVMGVFLGLKHVLPIMLAQGRGAAVNMASVAGTVGAPTMAAYSASKHAIIGITRTAAGEVGRQGVRVNAICPGPVETEMAKLVHSVAIRSDYHDTIPLGRYGTTGEMAELVGFLCSPTASYLTGQCLANDGGFEATGVGLPTFRRTAGLNAIGNDPAGQGG